MTTAIQTFKPQTTPVNEGESPAHKAIRGLKTGEVSIIPKFEWTNPTPPVGFCQYLGRNSNKKYRTMNIPNAFIVARIK